MFDRCILCEIIPIIKLIDIHINIQSYLFSPPSPPMVRTLKIYSCSNVQVYNRLPLTAVNVLFVRAPELTHLVTGSLCF